MPPALRSRRFQADARDAIGWLLTQPGAADLITEDTRTGDLGPDLTCLRRRPSGARRGEEAASPSFVASSPAEVAA